MPFAAIFKGEKNWFTKKYEECNFPKFFEEKKQRRKNMELNSKDDISHNFWKKKKQRENK